MEDNLFNTLQYQSKFSIDEIIPVLENKLTNMYDKEYTIDCFINSIYDTKTLEVRYLAFPKRESYIKAFIKYYDTVYTYEKLDDKRQVFKKQPASNFEKVDFNLDIEENEEVFLIGHQYITVDQAMFYLTLPHKEEYLLHNDFFCYDSKFDESLGDVITKFAKTKTPKK